MAQEINTSCGKFCLIWSENSTSPGNAKSFSRWGAKPYREGEHEKAYIGNAVGMSKNTIRKYVGSLIEKRLITTEPTTVYTQKGEKRNGNLRYTIRPIAEAIEQYYEQQRIRLHEEVRRQVALKKLAEFDRKNEKSAV